jgi:cysteine-rich repeat protein
VDTTSTLCYPCSAQCLTCFGPTARHCLSCEYPLWRNPFSQCVPLLCPYGQYVDSVKGCRNCSFLFNDSLTCNNTQALLCHRSTMLAGGMCVACETVTGFRLDGQGNCNEICGDGLLIKYQCDDGNRRNGDGCSSNCLIEQGWTCTNSSSGSQCLLTSPLSMTLQKVQKYARENSILMMLEISLPLYLDSSNFKLLVKGVDPAYYWVEVQPQQANNLREISCLLRYQVSLAGKEIELLYNNSGRRL